jgi:hypothetical protein
LERLRGGTRLRRPGRLVGKFVWSPEAGSKLIFWFVDTSNRGRNSPRGGSPFVRGPLNNLRNNGSGSGAATPTRGRGRGRGRGDANYSTPRRGPIVNQAAPLSRLLYSERPLLKPVIFVRSVHTATLFQDEEDILQPAAEEGSGQSFFKFHFVRCLMVYMCRL